MSMDPAGRSVEIEVVEILEAGQCPHGFAPGQRWVIESGVTPEDFCGSAYFAIFPYLTALRFGGSLPWESEQGTARICCPDPCNPVVFRLRAL